MATFQVNSDNSISLVLTDIERETFDQLPLDQISAFITQWLLDKSVIVLKAQYTALTDDQKTSVLTMLKNFTAPTPTPVPSPPTPTPPSA